MSDVVLLVNIQRNKRLTLNGFSLVTLPRDKGHLQCSHAQQKNLKNESYSSYYNSSSNAEPCLFLSVLAVFDFVLHYVIKPVSVRDVSSSCENLAEMALLEF